MARQLESSPTNLVETPAGTRDTKERILYAAVDLLLESGPTTFETKEVANKAGVNQSQVNYHFGSRDGLLSDAAAWIFERHNATMIEAVEKEDDPYRGVEAWVQQVVEFNTAHPGIGVVTGFPEMFTHNLEPWRREACALRNLDTSEKMGTVLFSCLYAIHTGKRYKRLNRAKIAVVTLRYPSVMNAAVILGMSMAGFAQVLAQHNAKPIFGFDPTKALRKAIRAEMSALAKNSTLHEGEDDDLFQ